MHRNGHAVMAGFPEHVMTAGDADNFEAESAQYLNGLLAVDSGIYGHLPERHLYTPDSGLIQREWAPFIQHRLNVHEH